MERGLRSSKLILKGSIVFVPLGSIPYPRRNPGLRKESYG